MNAADFDRGIPTHFYVPLEALTSSEADKDNITKLQDVFHSTDPAHVAVIYERLADFAIASGISQDEMVNRVIAGHDIAVKIAGDDPKYRGSKAAGYPHPTDDLINLDWFIRAQMAKSGALYMKGAVKFPDPDQKFMTFIMHTRSTYHGYDNNEPKGRWSSHWPEHVENIKKTPIPLRDGTWVCFSDYAEKGLLELGVDKKFITNFKKPAICVDASGPQSNPGMGVAGSKNATFLIMCFPERDLGGTFVMTVGMKTEGFSAVGIGETGYGKWHQRLGDNIDHIGQWAKKKGPESLRQEVVDEGEFKDLKEDKLDKEIASLMKSIKLMKGKKDGTDREKALYNSYQNLKETTKLGSDPSNEVLKDHLALMLPLLTQKSVDLTQKYSESGKKKDLDKLKEAEGARRAAGNIIRSIVSHEREAKAMSEDWKYALVPRSREVLLPTIDEMVQDKVPFLPNPGV